jgi:pyruvate/2-oxoglutarate dehydrogenase complex dihydrolipoamide dehydrogenase (E3) component
LVDAVSWTLPVESIYAVGDVNGIALLDSVATAQANVAVENIPWKTSSVRQTVVLPVSPYPATHREHWLD